MGASAPPVYRVTQWLHDLVASHGSTASQQSAGARRYARTADGTERLEPIAAKVRSCRGMQGLVLLLLAQGGSGGAGGSFWEGVTGGGLGGRRQEAASWDWARLEDREVAEVQQEPRPSKLHGI